MLLSLFLIFVYFFFFSWNAVKFWCCTDSSYYTCCGTTKVLILFCLHSFLALLNFFPNNFSFKYINDILIFSPKRLRLSLYTTHVWGDTCFCCPLKVANKKIQDKVYTKYNNTLQKNTKPGTKADIVSSKTRMWEANMLFFLFSTDLFTQILYLHQSLSSFSDASSMT